MIPAMWKTVVLLLYSTIFMTLPGMFIDAISHDKAWYIAAFGELGHRAVRVSVQVPKHRLGYGVLNLAQ